MSHTPRFAHLAILCLATTAAMITGFFLGSRSETFDRDPVYLQRAAMRELDHVVNLDRIDPDDPMAIADGRTVTRAHLEALVLETAGGAILEEVLLDRALQRRCREAGINAGDGLIASERMQLIRSLDPDPQIASQLLDALRRRRSLGTRRFDLFLKRNGMLRALVRDDVTITTEMLQVRYDFEFGVRYRVRVLMHSSASEIRRLQGLIEGGASFADLAAQHSTDISGDRGGLISDLSPADARYPETIRRAVETLQPGETSGIVSLDSGYAIVKVEAVIPPNDPPTFDAVRADLERAVRLEQERFLMDSLATQILRAMDVSVLDPALHESWQTLRRSR